MKKLNNWGFSLVEGLLTVIAICLVVGVGFYVYNSSVKKDKPKATVTVQKKLTSSADKSNKKYLEIPELGVKFELSDKLKNAYYAKVGDYYYLSVHELDNACPAGGVNKSLGLVAIIVGKPGETNDTIAAPATWTESELEQTGFKKLGDTYYGFMRGNGPCYDPNSPDSDTQAKLASDYINAFVDQEPTFQRL